MLTPYYCYSSIESNTFLTCVSHLDLCTLIKKHLTRTLIKVCTMSEITVDGKFMFHIFAYAKWNTMTHVLQFALESRE